MTTATEIYPVGYAIMFMRPSHGTSFSKQSVVIIAADAMEGITVAIRHMEKIGKFHAVEKWEPRWVHSDTDMPDLLSESALRHYAAKLGFDLTRIVSINK